jgi:hypothetical protein
MFWAKDESDAVLYLKKIKERKNINWKVSNEIW